MKKKNSAISACFSRYGNDGIVFRFHVLCFFHSTSRPEERPERKVELSEVFTIIPYLGEKKSKQKYGGLSKDILLNDL